MKSYTSDKIQYGVPIRRTEANRANPQFSNVQTHDIDINMEYRPYKPAGRRSLGSIEDSGPHQRTFAASSQYLSDFTGSEYSSDTESARFSQPPQQ